MKKIISVLFCVSISGFALAEDKIDWGICAQDLEKSCAGISDDHEKHECLEKAGRKKVTKACSDFNHSLEGKFKSNHKKGHTH